MKSKSLFSIVLLIPNLLYAYEPSGRGYDPDAPFLGLPSGDEVWNGLVIGIIALLIGYLILNANNNNQNNENSITGCLGVIFMIGGFISLLPLLAWLCSILSTIFAVGIVIFIIIIIISLLKS